MLVNDKCDGKYLEYYVAHGLDKNQGYYFNVTLMINEK